MVNSKIANFINRSCIFLRGNFIQFSQQFFDNSLIISISEKKKLKPKKVNNWPWPVAQMGGGLIPDQGTYLSCRFDP